MKSEILSNLMESSSRNCIPLNVLFELTYNCNLKCRHCYIAGASEFEYTKNPPSSPFTKGGDEGDYLEDKSGDELSTDEIKNILDQLASAGTLYLTLSGGEVFTRKDFFEIAEHAKEKHFAITIFSNGTLITEEIAEKIADLYFLNVGVSINGASTEIHDNITGVEGSFQKSLHSLQLLKKKGIRTTLKCTLMKQNFEQYPEIIKLAKSVGAEVNFDPVVTPSNDGCKENLKFRLTPEQLKTIFSADKNFLNMKNDARRTTHDEQNYDFLCDAGRNFCSISPYGNVYPCVQLLINAGNLRESSFEEAWNSKPFVKLRKLRNRDLPVCSSCKMLSACNRCPGLALLEEGDLLGPSKIACTIANMMTQKLSV